MLVFQLPRSFRAGIERFKIQWALAPHSKEGQSPESWPGPLNALGVVNK